MNEPVTLRGRTICPEDLVQIKEVVSQHWGQGRQAINSDPHILYEMLDVMYSVVSSLSYG